MGEVYRARDTRLDRTVAIKVLPSHLSSSPEIRQRFEREAKTISQLSHPHICALYDVGREGETEFLVMEYLEGETLADRIGRGALPLEQTLRHGIEIGDALDRAHRQGIVHRDLKPGNVMLTKSGVKLLDFGLAKYAAPSMVTSGVSMLPTTPKASNLTAQGTILGTLQYMAPEQLEGKEADARTDIFAFGAVLYEMATGRKAFIGTSQASLIGAILKDEPAAISTVQPMSPPALDRVIRICLAKDPEDRWQSTHDVGSELKWIASGSSEAGGTAPIVQRRKNRERLLWGLLSVVSVAAVLLAIGYARRPPEKGSPIRFEVSRSGPDLGQLFGLAVAPDGRSVAYLAAPGGKRAIWIRALDEISPRLVAGTEDATHPFWSPDGEWIGFFSEEKLKKVPARGGPVQVICEARNNRGGTWGKDGTILFAGGPFSGIDRVSAAGGAVSPVTRVDQSAGETGHRWPSFLPDGRHFLYLIYGSVSSTARSAAGGVFLGSLDGKEKRLIRPEPSSAVYAEPGYLLFYRDRNLLAQPFDLRTLKTSGEPVAVAERVSYDGARRYGRFSASTGGTIAYLAMDDPLPSRLQWLDRAGRELGSIGDTGCYRSLRISPDGKRVAVAKLEADLVRSSIWIMDTSRATVSRATEGTGTDFLPVWFPSGRRLAFTSWQMAGSAQMFTTSEAGAVEALRRSETGEVADDVSPDGRFLVYHAYDPKTNWDLWVLDLAKKTAPVPFHRTNFSEGSGQISPDGGWLGYLSDETGRSELYLSSFPTAGERLQVTTGGAGPPRWSRDGKTLFYFKERRLTAVEVKTRPKLELGAPKVLFETRFVPSDDWAFDISADGQRFLVSIPEKEPGLSPIQVLVNWTGAAQGHKRE